MAQWGGKRCSGHQSTGLRKELCNISKWWKQAFYRPVTQWAKTEEGWCLKTSAEHAECIRLGTACFRLGFKDAKRNFVQLHRKWFSAHWDRKRRLSLFTHNLGCLVIRSHQDPHPTTPQIHKPVEYFFMPTPRNVTPYHVNNSHLCWLWPVPQAEAISHWSISDCQQLRLRG